MVVGFRRGRGLRGNVENEKGEVIFIVWWLLFMN